MTTSLQPRVLVVEDYESTRKLLMDLFTSVGAEVVSAKDGAEAVQLCLQEQKNPRPFTLIVMDIHMPNMNGISAAQAIRSGGYKGSIVAFSAVTSGDWRRQSLEAGIDAYFNKSIITKKLAEALLGK